MSRWPEPPNFSRREVLVGMTAAAVAALTGCTSPPRTSGATGTGPHAEPDDLCRMLLAGVLTMPKAPPPAAWAPVLAYVADLQKKAIHPATPPFAYDWEEIGPGYCYGPAFGHFEITHQVLDAAPLMPEHARRQMLNNLALQRPDGSFPAPIWMGENPARTWMPAKMPMAARLAAVHSCPPFWPVGVEACLRVEGHEELLAKAHEALCRQLAWFEAHRALPDGGYYYADILGNGQWESGMDQGIRFAERPTKPAACVDATSHVFWCRRFAAAWARRLGRSPEVHDQAVASLRAFIQKTFYCPETAWFHDAWSVDDPKRRHYAFEGMWPLVVGAASDAQAAQTLRQTLLVPERFNTAHPIASIARNDPAFELRCWRGPAWNNMTLWSTEACIRYGLPKGAREILAKALDDTAAQFARTGTVWEFYHPFGGKPEELVRKPGRTIKGPSRDYLGSNPIRAMWRLWAGLA